jgi:DNA-binding NtrC family response regulator
MPVLIIDDEPELATIVADVLEEAGIAAVRAHDGATALRLLKDQAFDLVLSDVLMPGMTGLELLARVHGLGLSVPFILMTAYQSDAVFVDAVRLGAVDFIIKPYSGPEVLAAVERGLEIAARERAIEQLLAGMGQVSPDVDALRRQIAMLRRARWSVKQPA